MKILKTYVSARFGTEKPSSFQLGLYHFNPPPKEISKKGDSEVLSTIREDLGGLTLCSDLKDKGMQTQYELNNLSRVTFLSN